MQLQRWITAIIAAPILFLFILKASAGLFSLLIAVVCLMALWEYVRIVHHGTEIRNHLPLSILGYISGPILIWAAHIRAPELMLMVVVVNLIASGFIALFLFRLDSGAPAVVAKQLQGILYIPLLLAFLVFLRQGSNGVIWIFLLLGVVFAGDTGAYYAGKYFGKLKLCSWVSPKKTVIGSCGGLAANLLVGSLIKHFFLPFLPWWWCIAMFLAAGMAGQVGDLFESVLKRSGGIKDSGIILPGHGGILDRIDALLFAAPVAYIFKATVLMASA